MNNKLVELNEHRSLHEGEIYLGFGIYARKTPRLPPHQPLLSLRILKPSHEGGDYELLLDPSTFRKLKKFAKKYWSKR